ncbi:MAG: exo-alpha-sialidase [Planctomycetaceae bacterium]|nr:exo-alpha-sialidase [Planctomycetaceae bacterium]
MSPIAPSPAYPTVEPAVSPTLRLAFVCLLIAATASAYAAEPKPKSTRPIVAAPKADGAPAEAPFSIPQIDLAGNQELQVVVDREAGQYLGHPTTVLLEDGKTMIIVYPKGHGRGGIVMKRSGDGGLTWSERLPTPESWATSQEVPTIYRTVDKAGKKRLIMFSGLYPIRQAVSEDGATWSELKPIGDYGGIVACASCARLKNGDYMALFHDDGRFLTAAGRPKGAPPKFIVYKILSSDGGVTWGKPIPIAAHPTAHLCEPGLVRSPDGKQIAVLLRENSRKLPSQIIFSNDEGETWTAPKPLPPTLTGDRHTCAYMKDGKLFITFRDMLKSGPSAGDWVAWVGTYDDLVHGREGSYRLRLMDNTKGADCAYPPVEVLPDGTIVATTYGHWTEGEMPYIVSVRIPAALQTVFLTLSPNGKYDGAVLVFEVKSEPSERADWEFSYRVERPDQNLATEEEKRMAELVREVGVGFVRIIGHDDKDTGLNWKRLPDLADERGFAGQFAGVSGDKLVMYGGTNFPDKPVWDGGVKGWYHDAYVLEAPESSWRKIGALPSVRPVGYGVSLTTPEGILCIGGADAAKHLTDVFYLNVDGDKLMTRDLPKLPRPCAYMSGAMIGSVVYVAGGIEKPDAVRTLRTFWSLDLKNLDAGWQQLEPWPGNGRMLHAIAAVGDSLYLSGGTELWPGPDGKPMRAYLNDSYRYTPGQGWTKTAPAPTGIVAAPVPCLVDGDEIIVFGGDNGLRLGFRPPQNHPGFPSDVYSYDTKENAWRRLGNAPFVPVATPVVPWHDGHVVVSGEIRPAVRTREVWWVAQSR